MSLRVSMSSWLKLGLLGAHVLDVPMIWPNSVNIVCLGQPLGGRLGHAEVDDLGHRLAVVFGHQHVRGLDVAVDDAFLMGVLDRLADGGRTAPAARGSAGAAGRSTR